MVRRIKKKSDSWLVAAVVVIVVVTSLFFIFTPAPEEVFLRSSDGLVTFEGVARPAAGIQLLTHEAVAVEDGIELPLYEIVTPEGVVVVGGELAIVVDVGAVDLTELVLYRYNVTSLSWEVLPTVYDLATTSVSAQVDVAGSLLVGFGILLGE